MSLSTGSPAIDATVEDPVYTLFTTLYGLDIRTDLNGTARGQNGWSIGAIAMP